MISLKSPRVNRLSVRNPQPKSGGKNSPGRDNYTRYASKLTDGGQISSQSTDREVVICMQIKGIVIFRKLKLFIGVISYDSTYSVCNLDS